MDPKELTVVSFHRFEGSKELGDVSVLYAVEGANDFKGVIIDGYGPYADAELAYHIRQLEMSTTDKV